jgi:hypothetical protein
MNQQSCGLVEHGQIVNPSLLGVMHLIAKMAARVADARTVLRQELDPDLVALGPQPDRPDTIAFPTAENLDKLLSRQ